MNNNKHISKWNVKKLCSVASLLGIFENPALGLHQPHQDAQKHNGQGHHIRSTMCTNMQDVVRKLPVEVLRGRVLPFIPLSAAVRLCLAFTKRDGSTTDIHEYIRDYMHKGLSDDIITELVIASKQAISWFLRADICLPNVRFGRGIAPDLLKDCTPVQRTRAVSLNGCTRLSSAEIEMFLTPFTHLERLDLTLCKLQPGLVACIGRMMHLTMLNLSLITTVKLDEIRMILTNCIRLRELNVHGNTHLTTVAVSRVAPLCSALTALDLSHIYLDSSAIHEVCRFGSNLQELNLRASGSINYTAMSCMADHCTQ